MALDVIWGSRSGPTASDSLGTFVLPILELCKSVVVLRPVVGKLENQESQWYKIQSELESDAGED